MKRISLALLLVPAIASAQTYNCPVDGSAAYPDIEGDTPCQQGVQAQASTSLSKDADPVTPAPLTSLETLRKINNQLKHDLKARSLKRSIHSSRTRIQKQLGILNVQNLLLKIKRIGSAQNNSQRQFQHQKIISQ
ncbi:MAG: hypothetical protein ACJAWL_002779 [Motiliproteus sp.]|jgi:hypothetical protein